MTLPFQQVQNKNTDPMQIDLDAKNIDNVD